MNRSSPQPSPGKPEPASAPLTPRRAPSIAIAFRTVGRTLRHAYENLGTLALVSIFWLLGAILVLPLGIVTAGLHRVTKPMTEERKADWHDFFAHWRADLRWSSVLMLLLLLGFGLGWSNAQFYSGSSSVVVRFIGVLFLTFLLVWLGISLFAFPIALRQSDQRLRTTLRNALLMTMSNAPGVLVSWVLLLLLVALFVLLPPLFLLIPGIVALWGQENARLLLVAAGYIEPDEIADRDRHADPSDPSRRRKR